MLVQEGERTKKGNRSGSHSHPLGVDANFEGS